MLREAIQHVNEINSSVRYGIEDLVDELRIVQKKVDKKKSREIEGVILDLNGMIGKEFYEGLFGMFKGKRKYKVTKSSDADADLEKIHFEMLALERTAKTYKEPYDVVNTIEEISIALGNLLK